MSARADVAFQRSRMGYYWRAIRAGERPARSLGFPVVRYKLYALLLSAGFTSVAGSLYSLMVGFIDPESGFGILKSVETRHHRRARRRRQSVWTVARRGDSGAAADRHQFAAWRRRIGLTCILYGGIIVLLARFEPGGLLDLWHRGAGVAPPSRRRKPMLLERKMSRADSARGSRVSGANLEVAEGEMIGLIGPNGAGKSTFFNCLAGDFRPSPAAISRSRRDVTRAAPEEHARARHRTHLSSAGDVRDMIVLENVMVGAFLRHPGRKQAIEARAARSSSSGRACKGASDHARAHARHAGPEGARKSPAYWRQAEAAAARRGARRLSPGEIPQAIDLVRRIHRRRQHDRHRRAYHGGHPDAGRSA